MKKNMLTLKKLKRNLYSSKNYFVLTKMWQQAKKTISSNDISKKKDLKNIFKNSNQALENAFWFHFYENLRKFYTGTKNKILS